MACPIMGSTRLLPRFLVGLLRGFLFHSLSCSRFVTLFVGRVLDPGNRFSNSSVFFLALFEILSKNALAKGSPTCLAVCPKCSHCS